METKYPYRYRDEAKQHLHTLDERPLIGTSTVMSVVAKTLTWWAAGMAVGKLGWTNSKIKDPLTKKYRTIPAAERIAVAQPVLDRIKGMDCAGYLALLDEGYRAHSEKLKDSAVAGTDLHAELERYVKDVMAGKTDGTYAERILPFMHWAMNNVKRYLWSEGHCHSRELWTGGISDVGAELKDGRYAIIDFKSSKEAYATHFFQMGGYDLAVTENGWTDAEGNRLGTLDKEISVHIVVPFGAPVVEPVASERVLENREAFKHALGLYKIMRAMDAI